MTTELWVINVYFQPDRTARLTFKSVESYSRAIESVAGARLILQDDFGMQIEVPDGMLNAVVAGKVSDIVEADTIYNVEIVTAQNDIQSRVKMRANLLAGSKHNA